MTCDTETTGPLADVDEPERPLATQEDFDEWESVLRHVRHCVDAGIKAGRHWNEATTVGEVAAACNATPERIVHLVEACGWLVAVNKGPEPMAEWTVYEDGE